MESNIKYLQTTRASPPSQELSRLVGAAVVSKTFCNLLLTDPAEALQKGFCKETFELTPAERALVMAIHATDIVDFARQVAEGKPSSSPISNGYSRPVGEVIDQPKNLVANRHLSRQKKIAIKKPQAASWRRSHRSNLKKRSAA